MMHEKNLLHAGTPLLQAKKALILLHGRGATAESMLPLTEHLNLDSFAVLIPRASENTWYPYSFLSPREQNEPWLSSALALVKELVDDITSAGIPKERLFIAGFSQGACLALEYAAGHATAYGGVIAFTGGLIGQQILTEQYKGDFRQTSVFIGTSDLDPHVPLERARASEAVLRNMHARTHLHVYKNMGHTISRQELETVNELFFSS